MNAYTLFCIIFLTLSFTNGTLSPSDGKKTKKEKETKKLIAPVDKDVFQRGLVKKEIRVNDILKEANLYSKFTKLRHYVSGEFLGYITPWNGEGYENAKKFHGKLDIVSPVWLTIKSQDLFNIPTHDVQKMWMNNMRAIDKDNHTVKIVPRVLFENWSQDDIIELYSDIEKTNKLIKLLCQLCESNGFDGYVFEMWNQFIFSGAKKKLIIDLIITISNGLRKHNFDTVLAVPPYRGMEREFFTKKNFEALAPHIRYFSLMTYDYSNIQHPGPNAPTEWIRKCIEYLVPDVEDTKRSQILMGLNFYGYHYTPSGGSAVVGSQYLKYLEDFKGKIKWDDQSEEHFFELKNHGGGFVFFPTLYSIMTRLELANEMKTGVSIWELGQGLPYFFDIL